MPNIHIVSGKYGGYRAMVPMMRIMQELGWNFTLHLCDQHMIEEYGSTWKEAKQAFPLNFVTHGISHDWDRLPDLFALGCNLASQWYDKKPDMVIVYGDRLDTLIAATAAHQLQIYVAHLQAGDVSGCIDDDTRNAVSYLADLHFAPDDSSVDRLRQQHFTRVYNVGDHHIDALVHAEIDYTFCDKSSYLVVHMHPDTKLSYDDNLDLMQALSDALKYVGIKFYLVGPCNDLHSNSMDFLAHNKLCVGWYRHLPQNKYISLLINSLAIVGNTSAVCIDAPFLEVKSVNVGYRQHGRVPIADTYTENLVDRIKDTLRKPKPHRDFSRGDGTAGAQTVQHIKEFLGC